MAQQRSDSFLADVFAINSFKINSTLHDIQKDRQVAENLSFFYKTDNSATYQLTGQQINLPGLRSLDRLAFDTIYLTFENNKLHDVDLYVPGSFKDIIFAKTRDQFNEKYGAVVIVDQKNSNYKKYVWNLGTKELSLLPDPRGVGIHYASKISNKKIGWIYSDRKGKGNGTFQLNLSYLEKLLKEELIVEAFEKILPNWETTGAMNHVHYELDFKSGKDNSPRFSITYSLKNYDVIIETEDTTSKIVSAVTLEKMTNANVLIQFENDLNDLHYNFIRGPKHKYSRNITYSNDKYLVFLDKEDSRISIMNNIKFKLP